MREAHFPQHTLQKASAAGASQREGRESDALLMQ
jgi:hypothetical protein